MSLMVPVDKLIKSLDTGGCVTSVFLDFSKAFDTIDHDFFYKYRSIMVVVAMLYCGFKAS